MGGCGALQGLEANQRVLELEQVLQDLDAKVGGGLLESGWLPRKSRVLGSAEAGTVKARHGQGGGWGGCLSRWRGL
jgi:hypothetical protein